VRSSAARARVACALNIENEDAQMLQEEAVERFDKTLSNLDDALATVRTGRANPAMLDRIMVDYYGTPTPLQQLGSVSAPDASTLVVQIFDQGCMADVEKAILSSDVGLTPNNDGKVIRLNIPTLTAERRKEMAKNVGKVGEEMKVAVRNVRRDTLKEYQKLEKDGDISEDISRDLSDDLQKTVDSFIKQIDQRCKGKEDELNKV
jgi:ribosome recycling factor